jgi:excisionase family DNA binding protein
MDEPLVNLTAQEVADLLRVNLRTIYRKVDKKEIPFFRVGDTGSIRFPRKEIVEWMNRNGLSNNNN